jgi:hypothetical protein
MLHTKKLIIVENEVLSRRDYQEILLARMAGGDLYANELRLRIREVDKKLDRLRVAFGEKALYGGT